MWVPISSLPTAVCPITCNLLGQTRLSLLVRAKYYRYRFLRAAPLLRNTLPDRRIENTSSLGNDVSDAHRDSWLSHSSNDDWNSESDHNRYKSYQINSYCKNCKICTLLLCIYEHSRLARALCLPACEYPCWSTTALLSIVIPLNER